MKRYAIYIALLYFVGIQTACNKRVQHADVYVKNPDPVLSGVHTTQYVIMPQQSTAHWFASYNYSGMEHNGSVAIHEGTIQTDADQILSAHLVINMKSIHDFDITNASDKQKLEAQLKGFDFFYVDSFPTAQLEIRKVHYEKDETLSLKDIKAKASAWLTIKGIQKEVQFPFTYYIVGDMLYVDATLEIDRTLFNMMYRSESAAMIDVLKDQLIKNNFSVNVHIVSKLDT